MALLSKMNRSNLLPLMIAILMFAANLAPSVTRVIRQDRERAFTVDICHPLPGMNSANSFPVLAAVIPLGSRAISAELCMRLWPLSARAILSRPAGKPDPPPPRAVA